MRRDLAQALAPDAADAHPDAAAQLPAYVDGTLDEHERDFVEVHLDTCARCREDVADLRELRGQFGQTIAGRIAGATERRFRAWLAVAAAVIVIAVGALLMRRPPEHPAVRPARLEAHSIAAPAVLRELRPPREVLRTMRNSARAAMPQPSGVVIESDRPELTWPAFEGEAVVRVFADGREIAHSGALHEPHWRPADPLPRGTTLAWQVEVRRGDALEIIPSPPAPPALFRVLDARTAQEIAAALAATPPRHLRAGVLYARAGVQDRAVEELRLAHADDLARSVASW
jgi:hypothetical protein